MMMISLLFSSIGRSSRRYSLHVLGAVLIFVWVAWWTGNVRHGRMTRSRLTWVPALASLSGDFLVSIDHVARVRLAGGDAYAADWVCERFPYPPLVPAVFSWVALMSPGAAAAVWTAALGVLSALGGFAAWATRRRLGIADLPPSFVIALVLFSSPVLFAAERGQCDLLVVPPLLACASLLRRPSGRAQGIAGGALALAAWVKFYPGAAVLGLLASRRWTAVIGFAVVGLAIGAVDANGVLQALRNTSHPIEMYRVVVPGQIVPWVHSLSGTWRALWVDTAWAQLGRVNGVLAASAVVLPVVAWVTLAVARGARGASVLDAYLLWITAAATVLPGAANDYNFVFLPMAILAVWDRRDHPLVHMAMAIALLALQPFAFLVSGRALLIFKLAGLAAAGYCVGRRAIEEVPREQTAHPPHFVLTILRAKAKPAGTPGWR
jgi:hypothetical protein